MKLAKKCISTLLVIACILTGSCLAFAESSDDDSQFNQETFDAFVECFEAFCKDYFANKSTEESVDVEELSEEIADLSPEEAYLSYAKGCALMISAASSNGYDVMTSIYDYSPNDLAKQFVLAEDVFSIDPSEIRRNKEGSSYSSLVTARKGYQSLQTNLALLELLMQTEIDVPEQYAHIDAYIKEAAGKLNELNTLLTNYCNGTDTRRAIDVWGDAEALYWDQSINALKALYYVDSMCD